MHEKLPRVPEEGPSESVVFRNSSPLSFSSLSSHDQQPHHHEPESYSPNVALQAHSHVHPPPPPPPQTLGVPKPWRKLPKRRSTMLSATAARTPGINPIKDVICNSKVIIPIIQIVDFDKNEAHFENLRATDLESFLSKSPRYSQGKKDCKMIRWIHVNGLSWDVIKLLGIKYELHPLALEDVISPTLAEARSKADYYRNHLFISVLNHKTQNSVEESIAGPQTAEKSEQGEFDLEKQPSIPQRDERMSINSFEIQVPEPDQDQLSYNIQLNALFEPDKKDMRARQLSFDGTPVFKYPNIPGVIRPELVNNHEQIDKWRNRMLPKAFSRSRAENVKRLTEESKVAVFVEKYSVFLLRNGILISFSQEPGYHPRLTKIFDRIRVPTDPIRETEDASMILQGILDSVGDEALEVVDEFRGKVIDLELAVMARANANDLRDLHILSAQILLLKSTLKPVQSLVSRLLSSDSLKGATSSGASATTPISASPMFPSTPTTFPGGNDRGFLSSTAKIYLSDVSDTIDDALDSLELFGNLANNLIEYAFDLLSYTSGSYMEALSVLNVIFLPMTFLTSYFGMEFTMFPAEQANVTYFWRVSIPLTAISFTIFSWTYIIEILARISRVITKTHSNRNKHGLFDPAPKKKWKIS